MINVNIIIDYQPWKLKLKNPNLYLKKRLEKISKKKILKNDSREFSIMLTNKDITIALGPAGTGKSFLAVSVAMTMLFEKKVEKVILSRPAVEAGERLGFLPGDLKEKVDPYLQPLYDALHDLFGRSICDGSPLITIFEFSPILVKNILI